LICRYNQGLGLKAYAELIEIGGKPIVQQDPLMTKWAAEVMPKNVIRKLSAVLVCLMMPTSNGIIVDAARRNAILGCCVVMLAAERYRLSTGEWPISAGEIEKKLTIKVPRDPYSGEHYHFKRTDDGLVIYSIGLKLRDDGGNLNNRRPFSRGVDLGFKLWDVPHRRLISNSSVREETTESSGTCK
jgi:hypothetical protein